MDFSQGAGLGNSTDTIPNGQLCWVIINVRGVKVGGSGSQYLDVELTVDDNQPFARRKIWDKIGDPQFAANSEGYRQMGMVAITRILEAGRGAGPNNKAGYVINSYAELSGLRVPIKVGVEKGTDGYEDKNRVGEWLTPNPASQSGYKHYQALMSGQTNVTQPRADAAPVSGFGQAPAAAAPAAFGFGQQPHTPTPSIPAATGGFGAPQPGFQQPQQPNAAGWGSAETAAAPSTTQASAAPAMSPSDAAAAPSWMVQANQ